MNHFADWTQEEWLAIMLPRHGRAGSGRSPPPHELRGVHEASVARHLLPATVDFRGTGADSPVKDQAACGSCWVGCLPRSPCRTWGLGRLLVQGLGQWLGAPCKDCTHVGSLCRTWKLG